LQSAQIVFERFEHQQFSRSALIPLNESYETWAFHTLQGACYAIMNCEQCDFVNLFQGFPGWLQGRFHLPIIKNAISMNLVRLAWTMEGSGRAERAAQQLSDAEALPWSSEQRP
jgi:hypothetical protein